MHLAAMARLSQGGANIGAKPALRAPPQAAWMLACGHGRTTIVLSGQGMVTAGMEGKRSSSPYPLLQNIRFSSRIPLRRLRHCCYCWRRCLSLSHHFMMSVLPLTSCSCACMRDRKLFSMGHPPPTLLV